MKVICKSRVLSKAENIALGYSANCATGYELTVGKEYLVLGMNFQAASLINKGVILLLKDDIGRCAFVPLFLLELSDSNLSHLWVARTFNESDFCLWPKEFFTNYFFDDLSDGDPSAMATFKRVCEELHEECK